MRAQLRPQDRGPLDELLGQLAAAVAAASENRGDQAVAAADRVVELARRAKAELTAAAEGAAAEPGKTIVLQAHTSSPAFEAIGRGELYFMGLWLLVLSWPLSDRIVNAWLLAGDRERIRRARRKKAIALLLLPLLPLLFWRGGGESALSTSPYKSGLSSGEIVAQRVIFPPVPFGLAEQNDGEYFRPPTWREQSEISEVGEYVHGVRSQRGEHADGFTPPSQPVDVRFAEPERNAPLRHPLGTDSVGRDILSRVIWGGRVSLAVGLVSTVFLAVIGTIVGALAGFYGGKTDLFLSRVIEVFQCFPPLFLILIVVAFIGPGIINIMIVLGVTRWTGVARLVRGEFLRLRTLDFVVASEALGVRRRRTIFRHILPNAMGPVLVISTFSVASGILIESTLSFLGFGVQLPIPSWGSLLIESASAQYWWIQIFPGLMIFLTVTLYNLLGEGVADALDPRQKI
jgi:peptide/nickel transport system permease protein